MYRLPGYARNEEHHPSSSQAPGYCEVGKLTALTALLCFSIRGKAHVGRPGECFYAIIREVE